MVKVSVYIETFKEQLHGDVYTAFKKNTILPQQSVHITPRTARKFS